MSSEPEGNAHMEPLFIVDGMLGNIARWLRILGYDTIYLVDADDDEILKASANRILLTSDEELYLRALKHGIEAYLLFGETLLEKLRSVVRRYSLSTDASGSRCTTCNGTLTIATAEKISSSKEIVPNNVDDVWTCTSCGKLYWKGGHWRNIERTLRGIDPLSM